MKIEAEQLMFELRPATPEELREEALQALWRRREREEAAKWTPEAYCRVWMQIDKDQWNQMPNYKRHNWLQRYLHEKERRECGFEMRTPGYHEAVAEESFQEAKRLAESWAVDIRKAFVERKPCPNPHTNTSCGGRSCWPAFQRNALTQKKFPCHEHDLCWMGTA